MPYPVYPVINGDYLRCYGEGCNGEYRLFTNDSGIKIYTEWDSSKSPYEVRQGSSWRVAYNEFRKLQKTYHSGITPKPITMCVVSKTERSEEKVVNTAEHRVTWNIKYYPGIMMEHLPGKRLERLRVSQRRENQISRELNRKLFETTGYVQTDSGSNNIVAVREGKGYRYYFVDANTFSRDQRTIKNVIR